MTFLDFSDDGIQLLVTHSSIHVRPSEKQDKISEDDLGKMVKTAHFFPEMSIQLSNDTFALPVVVICYLGLYHGVWLNT